MKPEHSSKLQNSNEHKYINMRTNPEIRQAARSALKNRYGKPMLAVVVYYALLLSYYIPVNINNLHHDAKSAAVSICSFVVLVFLFYPLVVGLVYAFRRFLCEGDDNVPANMFKDGYSNYWHNLWGYLIMVIKTALWMLLLIVPGIVMGMAYAMTPFILIDNPELSGWDACERSRKMMKGHKWQYFLMALGFFGLSLASVLTLFIANLWLIPYIQTSKAAFYESLKEEEQQHDEQKDLQGRPEV